MVTKLMGGTRGGQFALPVPGRRTTLWVDTPPAGDLATLLGESHARMGFWGRLFGRSDSDKLRPQRLDYLNEAMALERQGDFTAAITSYRLGLRDNPTDARILQNIAIALTKTGQPDEAIRQYRRALEVDATLSGAHYGLAFLLLKRGDTDEAAGHLRAFLARPPKGPDADQWLRHAESTLKDLETRAARDAS